MDMLPHSKGNKHVACSRCRDRKVKCDGSKPSCRRCQRNGHSCQYVTGKKPEAKSEWVQHLRTFSAQPGKSEASSAQRPHASHLQSPMNSHAGHDSFHGNPVPQLSRSPSPYTYSGDTLENWTGAWENPAYSFSKVENTSPCMTTSLPAYTMDQSAFYQHSYPHTSPPPGGSTWYMPSMLPTHYEYNSAYSPSSAGSDMPHTQGSREQDFYAQLGP